MCSPRGHANHPSIWESDARAARGLWHELDARAELPITAIVSGRRSRSMSQRVEWGQVLASGYEIQPPFFPPRRYIMSSRGELGSGFGCVSGGAKVASMMVGSVGGTIVEGSVDWRPWGDGWRGRCRDRQGEPACHDLSGRDLRQPVCFRRGVWANRGTARARRSEMHRGVFRGVWGLPGSVLPPS